MQVIILTQRHLAVRHIGKTLKAIATTKFCQRAFQPVPLQPKTERHYYKVDKNKNE